MWLLLAGLLARSLSSPGDNDEGGQVPMSTTIYRTTDGRADYSFSIERQADGAYRAYITSQPSYGGRSSGAHTTHRLTDGAGRKYICWDRALYNERDVKAVVAKWADCTQGYLRTGEPF